TDTSDPGSSPITNWNWNFGDGGTSTSPNPTHVYTTPVRHTVTLTVTTAHGMDSVTKSDVVAVFEPTALDRYLRNGDNSYGYELKETLVSSGTKVHVLNLTSQTWREDFVDNP